MKTKLEIMEHCWSQHGIATSVAHLCFELRKRFPNKKESYKDECLSFIKKKKLELKLQPKRYDVPINTLRPSNIVITQGWHKSPIKMFVNELYFELSERLKGMRYAGL